MRLIITFESAQPIVLPRSYNHILQGWLYNQISDPAYRQFLHEEGYHYEKRHFKLFVFSRLQGKWHLDSEKKNMIFTGPVMLQLASPLLSLMQEVAQSSLLQQVSRLGNNLIYVTGVEMKHEEIEPAPTQTYQVIALSPITVYSTFLENEKKTTRYYCPTEPEFSRLIKENLIKKSQVLLQHGFEQYGPLEGDFEIGPTEPKKAQSVALYYKGFYIKGYMGVYVLSGELAWLKIALDTGLGGKNAQGLGMVCLE